MLRDVFYFGEKPNVHPRERFAVDLADARSQCTTEHFWIVNEFSDYKDFDWDWDFDFLQDEDVWTREHNNVWPSHYQKDSGTWLCSENESEIIVYRGDVDPIPRKDMISPNWEISNLIDMKLFDFKWHPDPTDPPFIYQFGTQWQKTGGPKYIVKDATEVKYIQTQIAKRLPDMSNWKFLRVVDRDSFDFSWHPDESESPYIYEFGTQWQRKGGLQYIVPGATEIKYEVVLTVKSIQIDTPSWYVPMDIDTESFDLTWHPDPTDPPMIYQFGTQWQKTGGPILNTGGNDIKYIDSQTAKIKPNLSNWDIPENIDISDFDFSWHPDDTDGNFKYVFGTQWQKTGGPVYISKADANNEIKYVDTLKAKALSNKTYWEELIPVDAYDDSWHPDSTEEPFIYVFGNQWHNGELEPTLRYNMPGATTIKYVTDIPVQASAYTEGWEVLEDVESFDFSWRPNPTDPPYIYVFGNKQYPGTIMPTVKLHKPSATQEKFVDDIVATLKSKPELFVIPELIKDFDYSWTPNPKDPPYVYQFGTQWAKTNGPQYTIEGATETKFVDYPKATISASMYNWKVPTDVDTNEFDFSWHPDATSPPYVYIFGTQWQKTGGPTYTVEGATEVKYISDIKSKSIKVNKDNWIVPKNIDTETFDFTWYPDPTEEPFIYQFGTQWAKTHGPRYVVEGAVETKFVNYPIAIIKKDMTNWVIPPDINVKTFDFSWHPDGTSPPYIYQFGTIVDENDGPKYITPGHDNEIVHLERPNNDIVEFPKYYIDTTLEDLIAKRKGEVFWALNPDIDYSEFNFDWRPNIEQVKYIHAFGTKENINTQTYFVNTNIWYEGFTDINYIEDNSLVIRTTLDMFFVDKSNIDSQRRFLELQQRFPRIQKTRYLNSWVETINRCLNKSSTKLCWILNSELDYTDFEFDYYPNPWQMTLVHVFGTQYSHWGTTFMVNKDTFSEDTKYIKIIEHLSTLNFIKNRRATATDCLYDMYVIDHGNKETSMIVDVLKQKTTGRGLTTVVYSNSYFETFKKLLKTLPDRKEHYIWVCSSICDYSNFDFKYICDPFAREQLHVFPSDKQKFGDTFLVDVNRLRELVDTMDILEDYHKINYNQHMRVKRLPAPTIITQGDTHVSSIHTDFDWPYATFQTFDNKEITVHDTEPMSLWDENHKNIIVTTTGATRIIVPKEAKNYVKRELYDYPHMINNFKLVESKPLDIVFLSNGEKGADENYEHLLKVTKGLSNRVVRVDGVNGRVAAYHAAAEASNTPWMFTVFAKLQVDSKFDWNWQPDRLQVPKHYIFNAKNPVNLLEYGHQAMIAYNKRITLANSGRGLDFTLDDEHEVVDMLSGVAMFNTDEWSTWRTSFREALKLKATVVANPEDNDSVSRLLAWSTIGHGNFSEYSINGALDAIEYYDSVNGDLNKLRLSYDWPWLQEYFNTKYN